MMKITISVLGVVALGCFIYRVWRDGLIANSKANESLSGHTFAIKELTSPDSIDLDELKERIRHDFQG